MHVLTRAQAIEFVLERDELFDSQENPFARSAWLVHFLVQIAQDDWTIYAPEVFVGAESVMLLYEAPGVPRQALTNYYASLYSPIVGADSHAGRSVGEMVRQITHSAPRTPTIQLSPLDARDADLLTGALRSYGWYVKRYFSFGNWYLPCADLSFDAFMAGRDSQLRNTLGRKAKKFLAEPANRIEVIIDPANVSRGMDAYDRVFLKSWKKPEPYPDFVRGWAKICADNGWLRLGIAWAGDIAVAVQFWFVIEGKAYIFKLAYDEDFAKLSAGTILTSHLFRRALDEDKVVEIDYLTGDDGYKRGWMTHRRERVGIIACDRRTLRGMIRSLVESAGDLRRRFIPRPTAIEG